MCFVSLVTASKAATTKSHSLASLQATSTSLDHLAYAGTYRKVTVLTQQALLGSSVLDSTHLPQHFDCSWHSKAAAKHQAFLSSVLVYRRSLEAGDTSPGCDAGNSQSVGAPRRKGKIPLFLAALCGHVEIVQALLAHGADVAVRCSHANLSHGAQRDVLEQIGLAMISSCKSTYGTQTAIIPQTLLSSDVC
ncbi:hypothetical protein WJX77_009205 [Trebouxia sp. C0004]